MARDSVTNSCALLCICSQEPKLLLSWQPIHSISTLQYRSYRTVSFTEASFLSNSGDSLQALQRARAGVGKEIASN